MIFKAQEINVLIRNHLQRLVTVKCCNIPALKAEVMFKSTFNLLSSHFVKKVLSSHFVK